MHGLLSSAQALCGADGEAGGTPAVPQGGGVHHEAPQEADDTVLCLRCSKGMVVVGPTDHSGHLLEHALVH